LTACVEARIEDCFARRVGAGITTPEVDPWIAYECAQEAYRSQLQREAEPVMVAAPDRDQQAIGIVQVEISRQLCRRA
jgi:hypothetical protein